LRVSLASVCIYGAIALGIMIFNERYEARVESRISDFPRRPEGEPVISGEQPEETVCPNCRGAGVIPTRAGPVTPLMREIGVFCSCNAGATRWQATVEAIQRQGAPAKSRVGRAEKGWISF